MVVSMTGFGRSKAESGRYSVTVEVKTVNHRFCEFHIRMPRQLLKIEEKIKKELNRHIKRGRVEVYVTLEGEGTVSRSVSIDWKLLDEYFQYITEIKNKYGFSGELSISDLAGREELIRFEETDDGNEELEILVLKACSEAGAQLRQMRLQEGASLEKDMAGHIGILEERIVHIRGLASVVLERYRERLEKRMSELIASQAEESKILTEVAFFADKSDISEELSRLESHAGQFFKTLCLDEPIGRKLDFLVQEMNREANTIGSKANDAGIAMEVVEMKSLLEKVKEQVQNIE
ncbi:YicC/YloC family endoribonuclease [Mesobacillus zeae]|uniref:YicC family protein n=1 Tax=Mesobacillus zeae TaxID=1917180 RepID=A0A398BCM9_9BACI|nr:YicC/YloC family endoribonuclease [Mesobacillus zeae]RID87939.1 YicC family protein [Mesobacillus zeae]